MYRLLAAVAASLILIFLVLPLVAVFTSLQWTQVVVNLYDPLVFSAMRLSLVTSIISVAASVLLGTPLAYILARGHFRGKRLVGALVELPMVLPPAVAGVALLLAFGRQGLVGRYLGFGLSFSTLAVILAQVFVAAPLYIRAARGSFTAVDLDLERVSLTLGVPPSRTFYRVTIPLSLPGLFGGMIMTWARAMGEFGATIMFAGNLQGVTRTLPLAIYTAMQSDFSAAMVMSALMIIVSVAVLLLARGVLRHPEWGEGSVAEH